MSTLLSASPVENAMLSEIAKLGLFKRPTINKLHYSTKPLPLNVVNIILKWLPRIYEEHVGSGEHLIRALVLTEEDFDPKVIIDLFENTDYNSSLKWTMAYVLSISRVGDVSSYIKNQLFNKPENFERAGFLSALEANADFKSRDELVEALKRLFDKYIFHGKIFLLFRKFGRKEDIPFLEKRLKNSDKKKTREIEKVILGIKNRKREPVFPQKKKFIA